MKNNRLTTKRCNWLRLVFIFSVVLAVFFSGAQFGFATGQTDPSLNKKASNKKASSPESDAGNQNSVGRLGRLIAAGKTQEAKTLFISEVAPNDVDWDGKTALHFAAKAQNRDLAEFFLQMGVNVDAVDHEQNTALNIAATLRDSQIAATLAIKGASIHHESGTGETPAQVAIQPGNNAFLNAILTADSLNAADAAGNTILHMAVEADNVLAVDTILRAARDARVIQSLVNKKTVLGKTALDICFTHRTSRAAADISASLITAGTISIDPFYPYFMPCVRTLNYNLRAGNGLAPLHYTVKEKYTGWTDFLLDKNADPNIKNSTGDTPLMEAALTGDMDAMQKLISRGAQVNSQNAQGATAMHLPIPPNVHRDALELFLRNGGGNPNIRDVRGNTPLYIAVELDRPIEVLEVLLQNGADVSIRNIEGKTPLFAAVDFNRTSLIPLFLRNHADVFAPTTQGITPFERAVQSNTSVLDELITEETVQRSDNGGNTALIIAVRLHASADIARKLLDKKANVNARNQEGDTALHFAVRQNDAQAGEVLLSRGADIFLQNAKGESPLSLTFYTRGGVREWMFVTPVLTAKDGQLKTILHWAAEWKLDQVIPIIVARGAVIDAQNVLGETPLFVAVRINSATTVRALLQSGASLNGRDALGNTALHTAVRFNAQSAAETLIGAKADLNAYNLNGNTPLHEAVRQDRYPLVSLFVQRDANIEARDSEGNTPLMTAVIVGNFRITDHFIRSGADVNTRNNEGNMPLHIAVREARNDLVSLLLNNRAHIHAKNAEGVSPFMIALRISPRMVWLLISKGQEQTDEEGRSLLHIAILERKSLPEIEEIFRQVGVKQLSVVDRQGQTPLRYAINLGNWEVARFLTEQGSDIFSKARDGKAPAEIVLESGNYDAIRAVFGTKSILTSDNTGNSALHYAARIASTDIINLLLELGAAKNARNTSNQTPAEIALLWGRNDIVSLLR